MWFLTQSTKPFIRLTQSLEGLVRNRLWAQVLIGLGLGLVFGILIGPDMGLVGEAKRDLIAAWVALPGELFLRLITMVLIPLVVASIIRGLGGTTDTASLKSVGLRFAGYVVVTTTLACTVGITIAKLIRPGSYVTVADVTIPDGAETADLPTMTELPMSLVNIIPKNPLAAAIEGEMLAVVVAAIIAGLALALHKNKKIEPLLDMIDGILSVCMTIVRWALVLAPFAVFGLMARMAAETGLSTLVGMGVYVGTVLLGLLILFVVYLIAVTVLGRMSPVAFIRAIIPAQLLAFSASSSAAVLPLSMRIAEERLKIDERVSKVVLPLGTTVNMDGTALYQSVAILFLAQTAGMELGLAQSILIVVTLVFSSIGAPSTPGVGMVILGSIAANVGVPVAALPLIFGVDRILDMSRTALNVTGDLTACVVLGRRKS